MHSIQPIDIGTIAIGQGHPLVLIAGPCVIEEVDQLLRTAATLRDAAHIAQLPFVFKASFDKANRSRVSSYRGPGIDEGLRALERVHREVGVPVCTDVHSPDQATSAAEVVQLLQVPAFLCRQTDLITACANTGRPVNVKKGQFLAPGDVSHIADKIRRAGTGGMMVTERGTTFGHHDLVVDMRGIPLMQSFGIPVCFDATHSTQQPGGPSGQTGGQRHLAPILARAAVAAGADAIFIEAHPQPDRARSDAATQLSLDDIPELLKLLVRIRTAVGPTHHIPREERIYEASDMEASPDE